MKSFVMAPDVSHNSQGTANSINPKKWESITSEINIFLRENVNKCTKCKEFIHIFRDNPQFSMQLHYSKAHKPSAHITRENSDWKYEKGVNYICPVCMKSIPIIKKQVAHSVTNHIEKSSRLVHQFNFIAKTQNSLKKIFTSDLKIRKNHEGYFEMRDSHLFCQLCDHNLGIIDQNVKSLCAIIKGHISCRRHLSQHKAENQKMVNAILCYNNGITSEHENTHLNKNVLSRSSSSKIINKNKKFMKKNGVHYLCKLCNKHICYFPDENTQLLNFIFHFIGEEHKKSLVFKLKYIYHLFSPKGVTFGGKPLKEHSLGYTHEIHRERIKYIEDQDNSKGIIRSPGGGGIPAPPRSDQTADGPSTSQAVQQFQQVASDTNKMTYESIIILDQHPMFAPHVRLLNFVDGIFMCTLCGVILTLSPSETDHLVQHILGSRHTKLSQERNIPVPDGSCTLPNDDRELVGTSPRDQIQKLSLEPEFAPHVQYLILEGNKCRCLICGVFLSVSMFVNHNLKDHIRGSIHQKNFERAVASDDTEDDNSSESG